MKTLVARKTSKTWIGVSVAFVALLILLAVTVGTGQWQIRPILSGSMRPGLPVGGVAVTEREPLADLHVRDVVVTHPPGEPNYNLVHRVTEIYSRTGSSAVVQTMGDANNAPDPFKVTIKGPYIYKVGFTVPLGGYPAVALHSVRGRRALLSLTVLMLGIVAARMWLDTRRKRRGAAAADAGSTAGSAGAAGSSGSAADVSGAAGSSGSAADASGAAGSSGKSGSAAARSGSVGAMAGAPTGPELVSASSGER
ncbi:MAG TPA: signal peptidase I [Acidimicrobiales bacterium]|nr:signal peptidase I [Acidimicrobiales bacterium]